MKVAYDLRYAADHFTGIGTHAFELLAACLEETDDVEYVVLWNPELRAVRYDLAPFRHHPRVTWVERAWRPLSVIDPIRVSAWLRDVGPDVFLSPFYLRPPGAGCASVLTLHDLSPMALSDTLSPVGRVLFAVALRMARQADGVLTSSRFSRDALVQSGQLAEDRVHLVPLGVPKMRPAADARPAGVPDMPFALIVGENRPRKNLQVLANAWPHVDAPEPFALVSAGRTDQRFPTLTSLSAPTTPQRPIVELGWTPSDAIGWLYRHATMMLVPSRYEGFGFPLVEGFAANVPVLAADIPTFREVGGDAALYLPTDDPQAWAAAISNLFRDHTIGADLRARGTRRAAALTYRHTAVSTLAVLRQAATRHR